MTDRLQPTPPGEPAGSASTTPAEFQQPTPVERNWAMAAHLGSFVAAWLALGLLAPLIVMLTKGNESPYVRRHAVESLNFQLNAFIWIAVSVALALVLIGFVILLAYGIIYTVTVIMGSIAASQGRDYRYPLTIRFVS